MQPINLALLLLLSFSSTLNAKTFYLDPINGSSQGDGSRASPFGSLESVISQNLIRSKKWQTPFTKPGKLIIKNPEAPIQAGDTLILLSGFHGNIKLNGFINSDYITVTGGQNQNALLSSISLSGSSKWNIQDLSISPFHEPGYDPLINKRNIIVNISNDNFFGPSSKIDFQNNKVFTSNDITSWSAQDWVNNASNGIVINAEHISIKGNLIQNTQFGIKVISNNVTVQGNQIINFSADGLRGLGDDGLFEYNVIANAFKVDENHDDGFQSFTNRRNFNPINRVTIRNNQFFYDLNHPNKKLISNFQGIGCFDGFFNDWVIENNLLYINHWHGITLMGANNAKIFNNTVVDAATNDKLKPWIRITPRKSTLGGGSGAGNIIRNNIASIKNRGEGIIEDHNIDPNLYQLESFFVSPLNKNFNLRNHPLIVDSGSEELTPSHDIHGFKRNDDSDLGAFDFKKRKSER